MEGDSDGLQRRPLHTRSRHRQILVRPPTGFMVGWMLLNYVI